MTSNVRGMKWLAGYFFPIHAVTPFLSLWPIKGEQRYRFVNFSLFLIHKKYNYQEVYIIRGKQIPNEQIMEHCAEICKDKNFKMHLVNFQEFCDILIKKEKTVPTLLHFLN